MLAARFSFTSTLKQLPKSLLRVTNSRTDLHRECGEVKHRRLGRGIFFLLHRYRSRRDASGVFFKRRYSDTTTNSAVDITSLAVMEALEENAVSITGEAAASPEPVAVDHFPQQRDVHAHRNLYHDTQPSGAKSPSPNSSRSARSNYSVPSDPFSDPLPYNK